VIRNAIDTEKYSVNAEVQEQVRRKLNLVAKFVIANCESFIPQNNHSYIIDIFAEIHNRDKDTVLLVIGDGELKPEVIEAKEAVVAGQSIGIDEKDISKWCDSI
jgi:hypothetical protein